MKITRQKIQAVLRKAKCIRAVFTPSGSIGRWSSGYEVKESLKEYHIFFTSHLNSRSDLIDSTLTIYLKAISEAGINAEIKEVEVGLLKKKAVVIKTEQGEDKE